VQKCLLITVKRLFELAQGQPSQTGFFLLLAKEYLLVGAYVLLPIIWLIALLLAVNASI